MDRIDEFRNVSEADDAVNLLLYLPVPTSGELGNSEWLSFWGSYIGGGLVEFVRCLLIDHC